MRARGGTAIVFRNGARRLAAFGWVLRSTPPAAVLAGTFRRRREAGRIPGADVRPILIFVAAAMATSVVVAMRAVHPAVATPVPPLPPAIEQPLSLPVAVGQSQPPEKSVVGTLESVSANAAQIVVITSSGKQTFAVDSGAMVRQGSRTIKTADLQSHKGERVKVRYHESGGVKRAAWIVVAAPPSKKGKPKP
jgi:hypothetical protein